MIPLKYAVFAAIVSCAVPVAYSIFYYFVTRPGPDSAFWFFIDSIDSLGLLVFFLVLRQHQAKAEG